MITGPDPARCIFKETISDGSILEGGWTPNMGGTVFGDRIIVDSMGNRNPKPLRWCLFEEAEGLKPPSERRNPKGPNPKRHVRPTPEPEPQDMMPETRKLLQKYEDERRRTRTREMIAKNRWRKRFGEEPEKVEVTVREPVMSKPEVPADKVIAGLKIENERLQREHKQMQEEVKMMTEQMRKMHEENEEFKEQAKTIRDDAIGEVRKIKEDYDRKSKVLRWQIEAAPSRQQRVEGLEAKIWEIEDPDRELRYLVVASTPRGTERRVEEQWMADLKTLLERRFGDTMYYVIVPPETDLTVREVQPGVGQIESADYRQF